MSVDKKIREQLTGIKEPDGIYVTTLGGIKMSEIRDKAQDDVDAIICELRYYIQTEHYDFHHDYAIEARDKILALESMAVVDRNAELPPLSVSEWAASAQKSYRKTMLKAGWVREVLNDTD